MPDLEIDIEKLKSSITSAIDEGKKTWQDKEAKRIREEEESDNLRAQEVIDNIQDAVRAAAADGNHQAVIMRISSSEYEMSAESRAMVSDSCCPSFLRRAARIVWDKISATGQRFTIEHVEVGDSNWSIVAHWE